jgi:diadenosine tetraphosphatase ApaH/serine/threonine PP2A family protein phosphatase
VSEKTEATTSVPAGALPDGLRIYAVGDIHGRFDLLQRLAAKIRRDIEEKPARRIVEIYLGDYVDRGPQSREVVEWLIKSPPLGHERICLLGNHEDLLVHALASPAAMSNWLFNGGGETILSYLSEGEPPDFPTSESLRASFLASLPATHRNFFSWLPRMAAFGGYIFVHAGIRPGRSLKEQEPDDLIWIRGAFLDSSKDFGKIVVHGHTPVHTPDVRANRINIDTGAVFSGRLTCLVLEGTDQRFLQAVSEE